MRLTIETNVAGPLTLCLRRREVNRIIEESLLVLGDFYAKSYTEKHFKRAGAREYGYSRRKGENAAPGSKLFRRVAGPAEKQAGEILPLVHSGKLREGARTYRLRAVARSTKIFLEIIRTRAQRANTRPRNAPHIDMRRELTLVSDTEQQIGSALLTRELAERLAAIGDWIVLQQRSWGGI